ncbi:MAG: Phosphomannomutase [Candidatus Gottesmanbacteria bacterium GW2011_GWA2_44_17]|uniref:Phosphomannomutase n=3 Tax=Candidatus Gottesmaniibacteriota TaxID=1752720 RepID=A0A0G1INI4_9BACT|nr:MAG: Phosphomannomutase [Microgenomates group bacterium GW2011_GWC1_43_11]KKT38481.1 MAG: Phosphomannomutase [Candidatus Gottesmanbacteria bacterium GW2011_GWB1_44_11c]KKT47795.1 MAG: Phosphomannomutase [Candidatus Gottesmanbacteria bacterium GW2011_GWA2_44_17]KKT60976.1 MAG: Phosphomannomutase [Candidatus Gottesmanbacteria bacterium GW2011_GWA1_44_24b]HCM82782.1 phosphomannomutase/phosphoglucomutase [Patescibacteria group bacterium]
MNSPIDLTIFKDYDIRGVYPTQINVKVFTAIAYAIVRQFQPKTVAICRDMRLSSQKIRDSLVDVFTTLGIDVFDAGLAGTENQYFIAGTKDYDLVIMISASHNPPEYNGMKVVKKGPVAVSGDSGLYAVRDQIKNGPLPPAVKKGIVTNIDLWNEWKQKIHSIVNTSLLKPLKVVADAGNGMAGKIVPYALEGTPIQLTPLFFQLDGHFPNHVPNPLIPENNKAGQEKILEIRADVGVTFDGDADRMFLIDDKGRFVPGTITTALLARYILENHPGETVLYNAICGRIVPHVIEQYKGKAIRVRVGHSPIKLKMRETNAIFAGEHSGHYYYRDYYCAESGILSALMIFALLSKSDRKLSELVDELNIYPSSGEINFSVSDIPSVLSAIKAAYADAVSTDELDGVSVWYPTYWFNFRPSKTEQLLRMNIEADTADILKQKTDELLSKMASFGAKIK